MGLLYLYLHINSDSHSLTFYFSFSHYPRSTITYSKGHRVDDGYCKIKLCSDSVYICISCDFVNKKRKIRLKTKNVPCELTVLRIGTGECGIEPSSSIKCGEFRD